MSQHQTDTLRWIEDLKKSYEELNTRRIQSQTQLEQAEENLQRLEAEAVKEFGTSDLKELESKLAEMEDENKNRCDDYQKLLDSITQELKQIEDQVGGPTKPGNSDA